MHRGDYGEYVSILSHDALHSYPYTYAYGYQNRFSPVSLVIQPRSPTSAISIT